jgi:hypothetical protein
MTDMIRGTHLMKTERSIWIWALVAGLMVPGTRIWAQGTSGSAKTAPSLRLQTPDANRRIQNNNIIFSWRVLDGSPAFLCKRFDVQVWDKKKRFKREFRVEPRDTTGYGQLVIFNNRQVFKRHGKYFWKVIGTDSTGRQLASGTGVFVIPAPKLDNRIVQPFYPLSVRYQYNHWSDFESYKSFVHTIYPKSHLQSQSDLSLGFHHAWGETAAFELQERLLLLSKIGLGAELAPRFRVLRNSFVAWTVWGRGKQCWYSTGLENYASTLIEAAVGCEFAVMPGGSLTVSGAWIPLQKIRYGLLAGGLRTFEGSGFEAGVRLTLPRSLLSTIRVLGYEVDFQRIPLGVEFGRVKDGYSGIRLDYRKFYIEYLF